MLYKFHVPRDELAERLGKGIPRGALAVVEGEQGSGKSILLSRFIHGFLENGHTVTLVSTQFTTNAFIEQMESLAYPVEEELLDGRLLFLPVYPLVGFQRPKQDVLDRLLGARAMYERDIVVIDSLSSILASYMKTGAKDLQQRLDQLLYMLKLVCARGTTIVLALESEDLPPDLLGPLRAAADIFLNTRVTVVGGSVARTLLVRRFARAENNVADIIGFRVEPRAGLIVEIKNVS